MNELQKFAVTYLYTLYEETNPESLELRLLTTSFTRIGQQKDTIVHWILC